PTVYLPRITALTTLRVDFDVTNLNLVLVDAPILQVSGGSGSIDVSLATSTSRAVTTYILVVKAIGKVKSP
ncbi:hypothetical protein, partial [Acidaminococcus sp.]|uniref:hypothetical protein n=1 Tax=Acidaminococcus sp. TaxID=1872103 RepID=UPI003D7CEC66